MIEDFGRVRGEVAGVNDDLGSNRPNTCECFREIGVVDLAADMQIAQLRTAAPSRPEGK